MWKSAASGLFLALLLAGCGGNPSLVVCERATVTLNLHSGYDQYASATLADGQMDNEWWITLDPDPNGTVPRQATVVPNTWGTQGYTNSKFIAPNADATPPYIQPVPSVILYEYTYYFTLPNGASSPSLKLKANADDAIKEISLNGNVLYTFTGDGGNFAYPPATASTSNASYFNYGYGSTLNKLVIKVMDTYRSKTGLIVEGQISYTDCCREPIQLRPEVQSLSFFESTGPNPGLSTITIPKNDNKLLTRLSTLSPNSSDFNGVATENYDVFYSNWDGTPNPNGAFITIEAVYDKQDFLHK